MKNFSGQTMELAMPLQNSHHILLTKDLETLKENHQMPKGRIPGKQKIRTGTVLGSIIVGRAAASVAVCVGCRESTSPSVAWIAGARRSLC